MVEVETTQGKDLIGNLDKKERTIVSITKVGVDLAITTTRGPLPLSTTNVSMYPLGIQYYQEKKPASGRFKK